MIQATERGGTATPALGAGEASCAVARGATAAATAAAAIMFRNARHAAALQPPVRTMAPSRVVVPLLLVALAACRGAEKGSTSAAAPAARPDTLPASPADTLHFTMRTVERTSETTCGQASKAGKQPCVTATITWPVIADSGAGPAAVRAFVERIAAASFQTGDNLGSPDSVLREMTGVQALMMSSHKGYSTPWSLERKVTVACNGPRLAGLRIESRQYTGGAHPETLVRFANFDPRTGEALGIRALVKPDSFQAFRRAAARRFVQDREKGESTSVGSVKMNPDSFVVSDNVLACGDTLEFHYDAYRLGPHSLPNVSLRLPRAAVPGMLLR